MNILKWIFNHGNIESELISFKFENEKLINEIKLLEKWNEGYMEHIRALEKDKDKLFKTNKKLSEFLTSKTLLNTDFQSKVPYRFVFTFEKNVDLPVEFVGKFLKDLEDYYPSLHVVDYNYCPSETYEEKGNGSKE